MKATTSLSAVILTPETAADLSMLERILGPEFIQSLSDGNAPKPIQVIVEAHLLRSDGESDRLAIKPIARTILR